ncbi:MAG TPA: hypothetical protein VGO11_09925 [Chthoniobacteraceae bacterium]|jgi:hypothetical protein|nr:hypothetical protein [Chthoniobacteraceae bacterium]
MNTCFDTSDIMELSRVTLDETDRRLQGLSADLCSPFYAEARTLEQHLLQIYRMVALCAKKEDDLDKIASWWAAMTEVCDHFAEKLNVLCTDHPACGADYFYDRVLDLRNKCQRLNRLHA